MLLGLIIVGSLALSFATVYSAQLVKEGAGNGGYWSSLFVVGGMFFTSAMFLLLLWFVMYSVGYVSFPVVRVFWYSLAATVAFNILQTSLRFKAYELVDVGLVAPFAAISPVLSVVTAWLFLGELPTLGGFVGIVLVACSIYLLYSKNRQGLFDPLLAVWKNRGTRYAFLAGVTPAVSIVFDKQAVSASDPLTFSAFVALGIGLGSWIFDLAYQKKDAFIRQFSKHTMSAFLKISSWYVVAIGTFNAALLFDVVPHVSALRRLVIVFEVLFGYLILKQIADVKKRVIASAGVVAGVVIIALFR